ncbi:MAG: hypothetical protein HRU24_06015 [Gammaproteobacteria bacterium]|nr:hypothetical protein [Gammaproteobacteria bacterium]
MLNKKIDRRTIIKGTAAIAAVSTLAAQTKMVSAMTPSKEQAAAKKQIKTIKQNLSPNEQYIYDIVERHTKRIAVITPPTIEHFTKEFVGVLGADFDYKGTFPLIVGEHEVMRCFMNNIGQLT